MLSEVEASCCLTLPPHVRIKTLHHHSRDLPFAARELLSFAGEKRVFAFSEKWARAKTTFIKTLCAALGVGEIVTSPTFAIINEYADGKIIPYIISTFTE